MNAAADIRSALTGAVGRAALRIRQGWRAAAARAARLTGAAVASFAAADVLLSRSDAVVAALTALLVVEVTLVGIVTSGIQRVISVVAGVLLAVGFASLVDLNWWSLGLLIAVSIVIGQLLRLGPHLLEVAISAMLVLAVGGAESAAIDRISATLIGAAVGMGVNLAFPPTTRGKTAAEAIQAFAFEMAELLESASRELAEPLSVERVSRWMDDARRLSRHIPRVESALDSAERSRRLNVRSLAVPNPQESLRHGLDALEHTSVAIRTMIRSILDLVRRYPEEDGEYARAIRAAFAEVLTDVAAAVRAFGTVVRAEVDTTTHAQDESLSAALQRLRAARARISELQLADPRENIDRWELNSTLLEAVDRILSELDVDEQARLRQHRQDERDARIALQMAQQKVREVTRQVTDLPKRRRPH